MRKILVVFLALLLLCGCTEPSAYIPTGDALDEQWATRPIEQTQQKQDFSLVYNPAKTFNPYTCTDQNNRMIFSLLYQSLFTVNAGYRVEPQLCKAYKVSGDRKSYVFYVHEAKFSDGAVLTAADVAASLEAARTNPVYSGRLYNVETISLTDDGGVQVNLLTPHENLPLLLDIPILRASQVLAEFPVGTGPYALESGTAGRWLRLRRDWWCEVNLPISADKIPLVTALNAKTIRDKFELGDVGVVCADPSADTYVDFRCDHELWDCENGIFLYIGCRAKSGVFSNDLVRQALTHAIDRSLLVQEYYRTFAQAVTLPAAADSPYYNKALAERYGYDAALFRQALISQDMLGKNIVILVNSADGRRTRVAQAIAQMIDDCGLKVTVMAVTGTSYTNALKNGQYDLHLGQTMLSPNMDLSAFYSSSGALNFGGMSDGDIYSLCQDALANSGNFTALHQAVMEDAMLCPVAFLSYAVYVQPGLVEDFSPARDNVFYYSMGKTLEEIKIKE